MSASVSESYRQLQRARWGVFGVFAVVGFVTAIWLVNIPAIQERTGTNHAVLGALILLLGFGALISMQFAGLLIAKFGSKTATLLGLGFLVSAVNLPGLANDAVTLAVALFIFGLGHGVTDVAMNQHAVVVEQGYRRPIMSAFHAFYSLGGALGAIAGAVAQTARLDLPWTLLGACLLGAAGTVIWGRMLLSAKQENRFEAGHQARKTRVAETANQAPPVANRRRMVALAILAFLTFLCEGAATDWSALQTVEHLRESEAAAALAFAAFATAMTVGRLCADRISHAAGPTNVVRFGSLAASLGMLVVVTSPFYLLSLLGWLVFGLGLSGVIPQVYTAAGNLGRSDSGRTLSRVVSSGYVGLLAGPAFIGWLGGLFGLTVAFVLPLLFCLVCVLLAPAAAKSRTESKDKVPVGSGSGNATM